MFKSQILQIFLDNDKERDGLYPNTKKYISTKCKSHLKAYVDAKK